MTSNWPTVKLGDLLEIKHGFAFKGEHFADKGEFVLLTPGNFKEEGGLKLKGEKEKFYSGQFPDEYLLHKGDIVVAMTDLIQNAPILGSSALIPQTGRYLHNQRLGKVINLKTERVLPEFVFYLFNTPLVRGQIKGSATGATVKHTAPSRIYDVSTLLPPLPSQRRIAGILSAYDELIENSQRRIRILEAMARALYREWFVHFRFPGHEVVPRVPSPLGEIPQGWEVKKLGEICVVTDYVANGSFASLKENVTYRDEPDYAILIRGTDFNSGWNGKYVHVTEGSYRFLRKSELRPGDIVVTNVGNVGTTFFVPDLGKPMTLGPNSVLVRPHLGTNFVFHYLRSDEGQHRIRGITSGVAQPKFNKTEFRSLNLATPPSALLQQFDKVVAPIHAMSDKLRANCANLRRTRDLLLQRLLSGQVAVDALSGAISDSPAAAPCGAAGTMGPGT